MTFAQFVGNGSTGVIGILNTVVVPLIGAFAFAAFLWGVFQYFFLNGDNEEKRTEGRQFAFWGVLGLVVFFSVWGLVNILLSTLGVTPTP
jgi:hypothetical protein